MGVINVPNMMTCCRMIAVPVLVMVYYIPDVYLSWAAKNICLASIFTVAALTDWLDGYLARVLNQISHLGAFLDPVADKLIVVAILVLLVDLHRVSAWLASIIIGREVAVSALREWMAVLGESRSVAVSVVGKIKTATQLVAIPLLLYNSTLFHVVHLGHLGHWLMQVTGFLTIVSMVYYLYLAWPYLIQRK